MIRISFALISMCTVLFASAQNIVSHEITTIDGWLLHTADEPDLPCVLNYNDGVCESMLLLDPDFSPIREVILPNMESVTLCNSDIVATKHLFNDDDLLEFIDMRTSNGTTEMVVINEKGTVLGHIPSINIQLDEYNTETRFANTIFEYCGKYYLYISTGNKLTFYQIIKGTANSPTIFNQVSSLKISPNPVSQGESIKFEIPGPVINDVEIYDINGTQRVISHDIQQENIIIDSSHLLQGINPYHVTDSEGNQYTGKIMVR